ncbi:MAG TPA: ATP-binding protein [Solirubrobacterales bacterium]|nr:ATP-binding protein [Solirubrobacterales bacterium]
MALADAEILRQNRWWSEPGWRESDPHLRELRNQPQRLPAPVIDQISLGGPGIHTLRGPRQVGKSTALKLLAERAIEEWAPARVAYVALDLLEGRPLSELAATLNRTKELAAAPEPMILLLDEVTVVDGWQTAIKALWDDGTLREDIVVCTGSSAVDLHRGAAERLPGRRGGGGDHALFPHSFPTFARALDDAVPASPELSVEDIVTEQGREALIAAQRHGPRLAGALERYLSFGGLPHAIAEAFTGERNPSQKTLTVAEDTLLREAQRRGAGRAAVHALLERLIRSLGSALSWTSLAQDMAVSQPTARDYVEFLAASYQLLPIYSWRAASGTPALGRDKKLYFADPLMHSAAQAQAPGLGVDPPALVENAVAIALQRRYEPEQLRMEGFDMPSRLHVWRTRRSGEIDFVCGPHDSLSAVEVKYQSNPDRRAAAGIARAFPGRPAALVTIDSLEQRDDADLIPAHLFLWALG